MIPKELKQTKCYLFDMDGTLYLGQKVLSGASDLLLWLNENHVPYYLLTNNSSRSKADYFHKLQDMGLPVAEDQIITSGEATSIYLNKHFPGKKVYVVGTASLESEFASQGIILVENDPDVVVLGFDTTLTYEKMRKFCNLLWAGKPYIATHADINCPTEDGFIPDIGAMIAFFEASTGRLPDVVIGKPNSPIVDAICEKTGCAPADLTMVGDRLYTDIAMGQAGLKTVLVLSGETKVEDVEYSPFKPDWIVSGVGDLLAMIQ